MIDLDLMEYLTSKATPGPWDIYFEGPVAHEIDTADGPICVGGGSKNVKFTAYMRNNAEEVLTKLKAAEALFKVSSEILKDLEGRQLPLSPERTLELKEALTNYGKVAIRDGQ
jgi:hypothetical protein